MKNALTVAILLAAAIALSACDSGTGKAASVDRGSASAPVAAPSPATLVTRLVSDNGMLTVDPAVIDSCTNADGIVASKVSWNATAAGTEGVELYLQNASGEKKLWSAAGAVGSQTTGRWMQDGSQVILVNGADDTELARVQIRTQACAKG